MKIKDFENYVLNVAKMYQNNLDLEKLELDAFRKNKNNTIIMLTTKQLYNKKIMLIQQFISNLKDIFYKDIRVNDSTRDLFSYIESCIKEYEEKMHLCTYMFNEIKNDTKVHTIETYYNASMDLYVGFIQVLKNIYYKELDEENEG